MKKLALLSFVALFSASAAAFAAIDSNAGTASGHSFDITPGAKPAGMGNAQTAIIENANPLFGGSPASAGFARHIEISAMHKSLFENIQQNNFGLLLPIGGISASGIRNFGTLGAGVIFVDYGRFVGRDAAGLPSRDFDAVDRIITMNYSKVFADRLSIGALVKMYQFQILESNSEGFIFDIGSIYRATSWMSVAATAFNQGGDIRYSGQADKLPKKYTAGVAFLPLKDRLTVAADVDFPTTNKPRGKAGLELWVHRALAFRGGYDSGYESGTGITAGIGIRVDHLELAYFPVYQVLIDYGFAPSDDLGNEHNVSLTLKFGE